MTMGSAHDDTLYYAQEARRRDNLYPPVQNGELVNCHSFENIERVVVTENHVFGRTNDGDWIELKPKSQCQ